jgi:hypothetical protein
MNQCGEESPNDWGDGTLPYFEFVTSAQMVEAGSLILYIEL